MMSGSCFLVLQIVVLFLEAVPASDPIEHPSWHYGQGSNQWAAMYPTCNGRRQSPVHIKVSQVQDMVPAKPLKFINYDRHISNASIKNTGNTVEITINDNVPPVAISEGGLHGVYILDSIHFHWGKDSYRGSDHIIDNAAFPIEMHIVHRNNKFKSFKEATYYPDGLAVLAVLFQISKRPNKAMKEILRALPHVVTVGASAFLRNPFILGALLPPSQENFFRYDGSLTSPRCYESVTWTVFAKPTNISEKQMKSFRQLHAVEGEYGEGPVLMVDNFRKLQPLNGRVIYASF